jgi:hypothetical protein
MKADAAARRDDLQARVDRRADQIDANLAAENADWAEDDAAAAIDARAYADELPSPAGYSSERLRSWNRRPNLGFS